MRIAVDALQVVGEYDGLERPYTYSDFAGNARLKITCKPPR